MTLTGFGDAERITGDGVSEGFFELLRVQPKLGRWFTPEEQKPGAAHVLMVSHALWVNKMGARPETVGAHSLPERPGLPHHRRHARELSVRRSPPYWTPIAYRTYGRKQHQYRRLGATEAGDVALRRRRPR